MNLRPFLSIDFHNQYRMKSILTLNNEHFILTSYVYISVVY